ncbi:nuclear transport factor 2 family protein [Kitasatospora purpeofusca]|uniref:nuclear transport factor 2 family protein n=1 Tax=Kitasatospora purpeofusca TaxID=67352 RepID=UPI0036D2A88A
MPTIKVFDRLMDAVNDKDVDAAAECYTEDVRYAEPAIDCELRGRDAVRAMYTTWMTHVNLTAELDDAFGAGDRGALVFTLAGTVVKELPGLWDADSIGRTFSVSVAVIARLAPDGLMAEAVFYWNLLTLLTQLGQKPA